MERKYVSSMKCRFIVKTKVGTFANWIKYHTRYIHLEDFFTEEGFIKLETAVLTYHEELPSLRIRGRHYTVQQYAGIADPVSNLFTMIELEIIPSHDKRLKVVATCSEPSVEDCFKGLLIAVWAGYPKAREGIERCWPGVHGVVNNSVTAQDFDQEVASVLLRHQECTFTRQERDTVIVYTIYHDGAELGWTRIFPSTGIVPGPGMGYGCTALTRLLQARESNPDAAEEEKPRIRLFEELFADVRRSINRKRWAAEKLEQSRRLRSTEAEKRPPTPTGKGVGERRFIEIADSGRSGLSVTGQHIFRKRGEFWEIAYGGEPFYLKDIKGLHYIAFMLRNPRKEFGVIEMVRIVEKNTSGTDINLQAEESLDRVTDLDDNYEIWDSQTKAECKKRLSELEEECKRATKLEDDESLLEIEKEKEGIIKGLRAATGLGGRARSFSTPYERARISVQQAIKRAFDKISEQSPTLSEYLRSTIKTGNRCYYRPDPSTAISWKV